MHLLIAEDEIDLAEALTVSFEKNQFSVDAVHDGFDAYEYAMAAEYDAIILDVMMPKLNGVEVLQKLRDAGVTTPVMMLTAKAQTGDRITGFNAGADDYLPKPFEPDELICRVRAMLRRGGSYHPAVLSYGGVSLDTGTGHALLRRALRAPERQGVSGDGAVSPLPENRAFRRAHHGARLGLGQRRRNQRGLGAHLQSAQAAQGHRYDHSGQPRPRLHPGGRTMIRRLRKRFIRIATLAVTAVLLVLCLSVNIANYISVDSGLTNVLNVISDNRGTMPPMPHGQPPEGRPDGQLTKETPFSTRYFVLRYDGDGDLIKADLDKIAAVTEDDVGEYLSLALEHGEGYGYARGYKYRVVYNGEDRWMAIFLDDYQEMRSVREIALVSLAAMAGCVALVYVIVVLCSRRAIDPVVQASERQKQFITDASHELKTPITVIATA